jgi:tetratricopeptide (TPR) repeat protein
MRPLHLFVAGCCLLGGQLFADETPPAVPPELAPQAAEVRKQFERGDYAVAEDGYRKLLEAAPDNVYLLSNLGVVLFRERKFKDAEDTFTKAIAVDPKDGFSQCTLGILYYTQGRYDAALEALNTALAINPKDATAHNYRGITLSTKGQPEGAVQELETAVALLPDYGDAHFNLAVVFGTMVPPDKENGRKHYDRALKLGAERDPALEKLIDWPGKSGADNSSRL